MNPLFPPGAEMRIPCPRCPDGSFWTRNGRTCPRCNGHAVLNADGSQVTGDDDDQTEDDDGEA